MATFYDRFVECSERWPKNVALEIQHHEGVESYTYSEVRQMAETVAQWIVRQGLKEGSRCAILADNHPRWVVAYLGTIAAGCTAVPLDTAFHADQVTKLLKDSGTALLFCDQKHWGLAQEAIKEFAAALVLIDSTVEKGVAQAANSTAAREGVSQFTSAGVGEAVADLNSIMSNAAGDFRRVSRESEDIAALLYTSGTTADPKGVMLTHANLLAECNAVFGFLQIGPTDAVLGVLPLFHALAQMANLLLPLVVGARVVYLETLNTTELVRALRERNISAFACVPQFFYLIQERIQKEVAQRGRAAQAVFNILRNFTRSARKMGWNSGTVFFRKIHDLFGAKMRFLVTGGSRWDPEIGKYFHSLGVDIIQAYGLTETTGGAICTPPADNVIGSVGKPLPSVEAKIVEPQQQEDGPAIGEIVIRGPIVMKGYWNREDATAAVLRDGWLYTGDLGYFDGGGNLFITGRKKEVIVLSSGKNVYPEEIEAHYLKSPLIEEICVMGLVSAPGEPFSERLHAVIVPNFEILRQRKIVNAKEAIRFDIEGLSQGLASTKRILSYEIWQDDLPRTTTRKLKRFEIEKRVRAGQQEKSGETEKAAALTEEEAAWMRHADVMRALELVRQSAKTAPSTIGPKDNLELDLGLDSMQRIELLVALENEMGGDVDEGRVSEIYNVRDLIDAVRDSAEKEIASGSAKQAHFAGWNVLLAEEPRDPDVLKLAKPRPISEAFLYVIFKFLEVFARDRFPLRVTGLENLPKRGPFILCPNHESYIDPFLLTCVLPREIFRGLFSVGTSEIFGTRFMRRVATFIRVVVVDPDANLMPAMRAGAYGLRKGRVLVLFPEGERSIDGEPKVFKKGAAILSIHLHVPIVPVALQGFYPVWPRGKSFQGFRSLRMEFGAPIEPPQSESPGEAEYTEFTSKLKAEVVKMREKLKGKGHELRS